MQPKEEILKQGYIDIRIRIAGIIQRQRFLVQKEHSGYGEVIYLVTKGKVPPVDLARLAEELKFPMRSPFGTAFPKGKTIQDFAQK